MGTGGLGSGSSEAIEGGCGTGISASLEVVDGAGVEVETAGVVRETALVSSSRR